MWLFFSLGAVVVMSLSNILDSFLSNNRFKSGLSLALFSAVMNIMFVPIVMWIDPPGIPALSLIPIFIIASLLDVLFLIPYYQAMQEEDASVVAALFSLTRVFTPIFAYLLLNERLTLTHYVGFGLITLGGMALSSDSLRKFKLNRAFWLMLASSAMISLDSGTQKPATWIGNPLVCCVFAASVAEFVYTRS
jgi:uncharacterized membrane protein